MSRLVAISLILICVTPIFADSTTAENKIDSTGLDINSVSDLIIHRGETIEASITVRNLEDDTVTISFTYDARKYFPNWTTKSVHIYAKSG